MTWASASGHEGGGFSNRFEQCSDQGNCDPNGRGNPGVRHPPSIRTRLRKGPGQGDRPTATINEGGKRADDDIRSHSDEGRSPHARCALPGAVPPCSTRTIWAPMFLSPARTGPLWHPERFSDNLGVGADSCSHLAWGVAVEGAFGRQPGLRSPGETIDVPV